MIAAALRLLLVGALLLPGLAGAADVEGRPLPVVILVSMDGVRHDFPDRTNLPAMARMARDGVRAGRLTPVYPSDTFPGHVSLATGAYPEKHGIVDNTFIDSSLGRYHMDDDADWIQAEPLWIAAERQGIPAATYFWVGSETDWHGQGVRYREAPFDSRRPDSVKVDKILEWMALPPGVRPRLIMSYWAGDDHVAHEHGPDSEEVTQALVADDAQLGRLMDGLDRLRAWPYTTLILVSDHGMTHIGRYLDLAGVLEDAGIRAEVTGSAVANVYLEDPKQADAAIDAIRTLDPVRVYRKDDLPADLRLFHPTRTGDLVVLTDPPNTFSRPPGMAGYLRSWLHAVGMSFGGHGYDPQLPDMGGIFFATGRGVPRELVLPEVRQVDVAPTVARLLHMQPPRDSEGRPVRGIGEQLVGNDRDAATRDVATDGAVGGARTSEP